MENFDNLFLKYDIISKIDYKKFKQDFVKIIYELEILTVDQCTMSTSKGVRCTRQKVKDQECCKLHLKKDKETPKSSKKHKCNATLKSGIQCIEETMNEKPVNAKNYYCYRHLTGWEKFETEV